MATDMLQLIDFLGWQKVHIGGVSQGGMVCEQFCLLYPYRVLSCTLMCTSFGGVYGFPRFIGLYHLIMSCIVQNAEVQFKHSIQALYKLIYFIFNIYLVIILQLRSNYRIL